jgi:glycosyltransferase involved in cell wall biosynthesis
MKIVANLICQNGAHEILRSIESVAPFVDEFYVMDGGSTDGTLDILNRYKDTYGLTIFEHPYEKMDSQRNELLKHTPKDCWVVSIDQDEKLNFLAMTQMREFLGSISPKLYTDEDRKSPLCIGIPFINFVHKFPRRDRTWMSRVTEKIFYNDRNLHFNRWYHTYLVYKDGDTENSMISAPSGWAVLHYAFLDKKRVDEAKDDIKSGKRDYKLKDWNTKKKDSDVLDIVLL